MPDINRYAFWQKAIKGDDVPSSKDTMAGFYRHYWDRKDGGQSWHACAIWYDDSGNPVMSAQYKRDLITDADEIYEKFGWLSRYPIPHDVYLSVVEHNEPWPALYQTRMPMKPAGALWTKEIGEKILAKEEAKAAKKAMVAKTVPPTIVRADDPPPSQDEYLAGISAHSDAPDNERAVPGDNSGKPDELPADRQFMASVNDARDKFNSWLKSIGGKVTTDEQEKIAAGYAREFRDLSTNAENARVVEKKPVLEAGKAIDAKWKLVTAAAADAASAAIEAADEFVEKRRRKRREEEAAAQRAAMAAKAAAPVGAVIVPAPVVAPTSSGGFKARKKSVRVIDDLDKVIAAFIKSPEIRDAATQWALRAPMEMTIHGTRIEEIEETRI